MSYNILQGGVGRADPIAEVLLAQRADVVALTEADDLAILERIAARLDMDFVQAIGGRHAAALLSRWPIAESINHAPLEADAPPALLQAAVAQPGGDEWTIGVALLSARGSDTPNDRTLTEISAVLRVFEPLRSGRRPHLIACSASAPTPSAVDPCADNIEGRSQEPGVTSQSHIQIQAAIENGTTPGRREAKSQIEYPAQPFLDADYREISPNPKSNEPRAPRSEIQNPKSPSRHTDRLFAFAAATSVGEAAAARAWIESDRLAQYASDHLPLTADLLGRASVSTQPPT